MTLSDCGIDVWIAVSAIVSVLSYYSGQMPLKLFTVLVHGKLGWNWLGPK